MKLLLAVKCCVLAVMLVGSHAASAQPGSGLTLPDAVAAALKTANVPASAVGITVTPLSGSGLTLTANENQPMNPASTMKLVTTLAGLELLGPQYQWRTDLMSAAPLKSGVLEGDLWLRGSGDPQLVIEDLWLLVQRLRGVGVREIRGNLMLDRSAFEAAQHDPGAFDGEALRPYNAGPDALLLNYKAVSFHFIADHENKQARVYALPALAGLVTPATVRGAEGRMQRLARAAGRRLYRSAAADVSRRVSAVVRRQGVACQHARQRSIRRGDISLAVGFEWRRVARARSRGHRCRRTPGGLRSMSLVRWRS